MSKKILCVGFDLASDVVSQCDFSEKMSLLDWDVILFRPDIDSYVAYSASYRGHNYHNGKIALSDKYSFRLKEACEHWRREITDAVKNGKTVIVHLNKPVEVFVGTGTQETSGTGRNQKVTRHVVPFSSYESFPCPSDWTITHGSEMMIVSQFKDAFASYWDSFETQSTYEVVFGDSGSSTCIVTKHGSKPVGICFYNQKDDGSLILLPDMDFSRDEFYEVDEDDEDEVIYSAEAFRFGSCYITEVLGLIKALRHSSAHTPEPEWARQDYFLLQRETVLTQELLIAEAKVEKANQEKEGIEASLAEAGQLRGLLYETGKPLETCILKALRILGFEAENFTDEVSEFDAVFQSDEGRLLGEAEGKDNKAIAIGKLRQLSTNILEDLDREDVSHPAKGILFGNAYRLKPPVERTEQFTAKCVSSANTMSIGLVATTDLFRVAKYLSENEDDSFAKSCRAALVQGIGAIELPKTPEVKEKTNSEISTISVEDAE